VRYVPSVAVMQHLGRAGRGATLDLVAVGDPAVARAAATGAAGNVRRSLFGETPARSLPRLPGARDEVHAISRLFPAARVRYLHFATHALVSERRPAQSGLVLAAGADQQDAFLQAHEVLGLQLDADLVTLSACSTGLGREVLGELTPGWPPRRLACGVEKGARRLVASPP
jgi:CHAT domain-containing protein